MADNDKLKDLDNTLEQIPAKVPESKTPRLKASSWIIYLAAIVIMVLLSTFVIPILIFLPTLLIAPLIGIRTGDFVATHFLIAMIYYPIFLLPIYYWRKHGDTSWLAAQLILLFLQVVPTLWLLWTFFDNLPLD